MDYPKISIITPSYNQGIFLEETILSVLNQNYPALEYIVIDGGSTDNSVSILEKYADRITYWISEPDKGQADAINKGFKIATGEIVAWLNSDDCYEENTLNIVAKHFINAPDINFLFGDCNFYVEAEHYEHLNKINLVNFAAKQLGQFPYSQPSCFFKNNLLKRCGYLDTDLHYCLDVDLFIRFALNGKMAYTPHILSKFRIHDQSKTTNYWDRFLNEWVIIYSKTLRTINASKHIDYAKGLEIYHEDDNIYTPCTNSFKTDDINKSFIYFLQRQMSVVFPNNITIKNYKKLDIIEQVLSDINDKQLVKSIYLRKNQYYLFIKKYYLNPVSFFKTLYNKVSKFINNINPNITPDYKLIKTQVEHPHTIPIIIINYNNLSGLTQLIDWLADRGYNNINIIDNDSDYEPLLQFYNNNTKVNVIRQKNNGGHMVLWQNARLFRKFGKGYYVVTDPDVLPKSDCPSDFMTAFINLLEQNAAVTKVGFSLEINDIPDAYTLKDAVIAWEKKYWETKFSDNSFVAALDTTFALYRPGNIDLKQFHSALRTDRPYTARHLGWYIDPDNLSEEELHYINTANFSNSWSLKLEEKSLVHD